MKKVMGSSSLEFSDATNSAPPKLSLFSSIQGANYKAPPPGMATPPINSSALSIPFQWEEAPGKPRGNYSTQSGKKDGHHHNQRGAAPRLELPPRMFASDCCRVSSMASPTTVLDGPDDSVLGPTKRSPLSLRGPASLSRRLFFRYGPTGSGRWKSFRNKSNVLDNAHVSGAAGTFDPPPSTTADGGTSVKITRVIRRRASFLNLAGTNVLANIYEGLKQVVPWRRVHEKKRRKGAF